MSDNIDVPEIIQALADRFLAVGIGPHQAIHITVEMLAEQFGVSLSAVSKNVPEALH